MYQLHTHTHAQKHLGTGDFIPPQEAAALEVCHRDSSLKLMEREREIEREMEGGRVKHRQREKTGMKEDEGKQKKDEDCKHEKGGLAAGR